jgi:hydroxymethylbilane synthase
VVDAIVLARAGLVRLGLADVPTEVLEPERFLPAVGQGALAVEHRAGDENVALLLARVAHAETKLCVLAERGVLAAVSGDCQTPVAAYALRRDSELWLRGLLSERDGTRVRRRELVVPWPETDADAEAAGRRLGAELVGATA